MVSENQYAAGGGGENTKILHTPVREMTDAEKEILQNFSDTVHTQFIDHVAEARHLPEEAVRKIADGRIFPGQTAKDLQLIDRLGNLEDAVEWAGRLGGSPATSQQSIRRKEKLPFEVFWWTPPLMADKDVFWPKKRRV
ncbi:MAG: S49 family peptidase [Desulfobacterales bacterium]